MVLDDGPWQHRNVAANGSRFHVVEAAASSSTPQHRLVLLLHGFPQYWWAWRHQLEPLALAGHRVAAMDMRGVGGSDKPPRGYDTPTLVADVAAVARSLGAEELVLVAQGFGSWVGWAAPHYAPDLTVGVAVLGSVHPVLGYANPTVSGGAQRVAQVAHFQIPRLPERQLRTGGLVDRLLQQWAGPGWPSTAESRRYTEAIRIPSVAHCCLEPFRWAVRSRLRADGARFCARLEQPAPVPVLQLQGAQDGAVNPAQARLSGRYVRDAYDFRMVDGAGHFLPEEAPEQTTALLLDWLAGL